MLNTNEKERKKEKKRSNLRICTKFLGFRNGILEF